MTTAMLITVYLSAALVCGLIAASAAPGRGRHSGYWLIAAFLFPPSVILLFLLPRGRGSYRGSSDPFRDADDKDHLL
jgi:hypothetical protein